MLEDTYYNLKLYLEEGRGIVTNVITMEVPGLRNKEYIKNTIVSYKKDGLKLLLKGLEEDNEYLRCIICEILGELGYKEATDSLMNIVRTDSSKNVKRNAILSLGSIKAESSLEVLEEILLTDGIDEIAPRTLLDAFLMTYFGVPIISIRNNFPSDNIRGEAVYAIRLIGNSSSLETLRKAVNDDCSTVREQVLIALSELEEERIIEILSKAIKDESERVRKRAIYLLFENFNDKALKVIEMQLKKDDFKINEQMMSLFHYKDIQPPEGYKTLYLLVNRKWKQLQEVGEPAIDDIKYYLDKTPRFVGSYFDREYSSIDFSSEITDADFEDDEKDYDDLSVVFRILLELDNKKAKEILRNYIEDFEYWSDESKLGREIYNQLKERLT